MPKRSFLYSRLKGWSSDGRHSQQCQQGSEAEKGRKLIFLWEDTSDTAGLSTIEHLGKSGQDMRLLFCVRLSQEHHLSASSGLTCAWMEHSLEVGKALYEELQNTLRCLQRSLGMVDTKIL